VRRTPIGSFLKHRRIVPRRRGYIRHSAGRCYSSRRIQRRQPSHKPGSCTESSTGQPCKTLRQRRPHHSDRNNECRSSARRIPHCTTLDLLRRDCCTILSCTAHLRRRALGTDRSGLDPGSSPHSCHRSRPAARRTAALPSRSYSRQSARLRPTRPQPRALPMASAMALLAAYSCQA